MPGVNAFNDNVEQYEEWFIENPFAYLSELHAVRALLPEGAGMEVGVGTGRFAAPLGIRKGVEPSAAMAEHARKKGIEVAAGVAERLPYGDDEFDHCLMVTTVCFLDDLALAFREAHRVLRQGGAFLIGFVDKDSPLGKEYLERKDKSLFYKEATFYSADFIEQQLRDAGFSDFAYSQTLFRPLADLQEVEQVKKGHGEGSFVVLRGKKR